MREYNYHISIFSEREDNCQIIKSSIDKENCTLRWIQRIRSIRREETTLITPDFTLREKTTCQKGKQRNTKLQSTHSIILNASSSVLIALFGARSNGVRSLSSLCDTLAPFSAKNLAIAPDWRMASSIIPATLACNNVWFYNVRAQNIDFNSQGKKKLNFTLCILWKG